MLSLAIGGFFRCRTLAVKQKTIRTPVKTPSTNSVPLEMLPPESHTSLAKMDLRHMMRGRCGGQGTYYRYRQSPVTHANHEETSTNIRPTRSAIIGDLLHEWLTFGNTNPERNQGAKGPLRERPLLSLLARCEGGFAEAPPCHTQERKLHVKASAKRVQDLDKGDIHRRRRPPYWRRR